MPLSRTAKQALRPPLIAILLLALFVCEVQAQSATVQASSQCDTAATPGLGPIAVLVDSSVDRRVNADVLELSGGALDFTTLPSAKSVLLDESSSLTIASSLPSQTEISEATVSVPAISDTTSAFADLPISLSSPLATVETGAVWLREHRLSRARQREETRRRQARELQKNRRGPCTQYISDAECRLALKSHDLTVSSRAGSKLADPQLHR